MTKNPNSYIEAEIEISQMMEKASSVFRQFDDAKAAINTVRDELDRMTLPAPQGYKTLGEFLARKAQENPGDAIWNPLATKMAQASMEFEDVRAKVAEIARAIAD